MTDILNSSLDSTGTNIDLDELPQTLLASYQTKPNFNFEAQFIDILKLNATHFYEYIRAVPNAQIVKIIKAFKPFYSPSEKIATQLYLLLSFKLIDDSAAYDWVFSSPHFDVNALNFELKSDKHFYFYILELLSKENKNYHSYLSSKNDTAFKAYHAAALSFFQNQKVDPNVMYRDLRPMDYFLSSMERAQQTQFSKLILAYFHKNPEVRSLYNNTHRKFDSYLFHEHLVKEIKSQGEVETKTALAPSVSFWDKVLAFFFKKSAPPQALDKATPEVSSLPLELNFAQRFAVNYVALERLILSLEKALQSHQHQSEDTEQALLRQVQAILLRFLKLFDVYENQKAQNTGNASVEFFITKQFPQFLTGSLESYLEALTHLSGDDFLTAHTMLLENLQLMGQHIEKQEKVFENAKDTSALLKMKVEHKYLQNTMSS